MAIKCEPGSDRVAHYMQISPHERGQWKLAGLKAHGTHCDRLIESVSGQKEKNGKRKETRAS